MEPFKTICQYAKGELNPGQIDTAWSYILAEPELLDGLKTMVALYAHFSQIKNNPASD
jgi:hypothetical protein